MSSISFVSFSTSLEVKSLETSFTTLFLTSSSLSDVKSMFLETSSFSLDSTSSILLASSSTTSNLSSGTST